MLMQRLLNESSRSSLLAIQASEKVLLFTASATMNSKLPSRLPLVRNPFQIPKLCYVLLCHVMLCYVMYACYVCMFCYVMSCYVMLCMHVMYACFVMSCHAMLCYVCMLCHVIIRIG